MQGPFQQIMQIKYLDSSNMWSIRPKGRTLDVLVNKR